MKTGHLHETDFSDTVINLTLLSKCLLSATMYNQPPGLKKSCSAVFQVPAQINFI